MWQSSGLTKPLNISNMDDMNIFEKTKKENIKCLLYKRLRYSIMISEWSSEWKKIYFGNKVARENIKENQEKELHLLPIKSSGGSTKNLTAGIKE